MFRFSTLLSFLFDFRQKEAFLEQFSGEMCLKISNEVLTESIRATAEAEIRYVILHNYLTQVFLAIVCHLWLFHVVSLKG